MDKFEEAKKLFLTGVQLLESNKIQNAEHCFVEALKLAPDRASILNNLAATQIKLKKFDEAKFNLEKVLEIEGVSVELWMDLGLLSLEQHQIREAISYFEKCLQLDPKNISVLLLMAQTLDLNKEFNSAIAFLKKILELNPMHLEALANLGAILNDLQEYEAALHYHQLAIKHGLHSMIGYLNMAVALNGLRRFDLAIDSYTKALELDPGDPEIWASKGNNLHELRRYDEAIANYDKALSLKPDLTIVWASKGDTLLELKRYEEAIAHYDKALSLKLDHAEIWTNKANALHELKRYQQAIACYDKALSLKPDHAEIWTNKGHSLHELKHYEQAIECYDRALQLKPDHAQAWASKANALNELKRYAEAIIYYDKALTLKPDLEWVYGEYLHLKMKGCVWGNIEKDLNKLTQKLSAHEMVTTPFNLLSLVDAPDLSHQLSESYTQLKYPLNLSLGPIPRRSKKEKIRIGYFSPDFHNHPVAHLTSELFELHDKNHFELFAFSLQGISHQDGVRQRLKCAFDHFIDAENMGDLEIAKLARELEIDIAIDLAGHTKNSKLGIFSCRAAPIQVNWLGYPGTLGAQFMDYIVADNTLISALSQQFYTEKVVHLPHTYMVDDSRRVASSRVFTRQECGLPENAFVFSCFNNDYKFNQQVVASWSRILLAVENSVLWISENHLLFRENLLIEFGKWGIKSNSVIFAKRLEFMADHLARYTLSDLFLDTYPYNAHATSVDSLKAGIPVLTLMGESFASRVAASLLNTIGLSELIMKSSIAYESLAIELATHPEKLNEIRNKLAKNRLTSPLFNTALFAQNLEAAYVKMYERYQLGFEPEHIAIA